MLLLAHHRVTKLLQTATEHAINVQYVKSMKEMLL